jgi:hypothetical protein
MKRHPGTIGLVLRRLENGDLKRTGDWLRFVYGFATVGTCFVLIVLAIVAFGDWR